MTAEAPPPAFDAAAYKTTTRAQWEEAADAWHRWAPLLESWLGPATEVMFDLIGLGEGDRVLDVAAGAGGQTLAAARRVGPNGRVLATDISPTILEHAASEARRAGFPFVETRVIDGEHLDVEGAWFDAAISRVGLIYFPDRQGALKGIRRALRPGGRIGALQYTTPEANGFFSAPIGVIRRRAQLPPPQPGQPGPFSLGTEAVVTDALTRAGFESVEVRVVDAPLRVASAAECLRFERESFGALHTMLSALDDDAKEAAWREIGDELSKFDGPDGFVAPCELIVVAATNPQ